MLGQGFVVLPDGLDRPVNSVAEGVADVLPLVTHLPLATAQTFPFLDGFRQERHLLLDLLDARVILGVTSLLDFAEQLLCARPVLIDRLPIRHITGIGQRSAFND
jgi:hypothetical protein